MDEVLLQQQEPLVFKLQILMREYPFAGYTHENAMVIENYLTNRKDNVQDNLRIPIVIQAREETGRIMVELGDSYSLDWAANELISPESGQLNEIIEFNVFIVPPRYTLSLNVPIELNPSFSTEIMMEIMQKDNKHLNALDHCSLNREAQTNNEHKYHIIVDIRTLYQLLKNDFNVSLGSYAARLKFIGIGYDGIKYGQSEGFQAVFSSLGYPFVMLGKEDAQMLASYLYDKKKKDRLPVAYSIVHELGRLNVECPNQYSLNWVKGQNQQMDIKIDSFRKQFKLSAQIPRTTDIFNDVLIKAKIGEENVEWNTFAWNIMLKKESSEFYDVDIIVDEEGIFNISKKGFMIAFGCEEITLDLVNEGEDNNDYE
ncbi:uncharacterized protein [Chironomus tepperi]|uniref:uncharacterized protein n=1 Tax=Chironomus tepperi TaxID=113505 RepID=UPI00391F50BB